MLRRSVCLTEIMSFEVLVDALNELKRTQSHVCSLSTKGLFIITTYQCMGYQLAVLVSTGS